jgi:uracil-DNA glycosylase
LTTTRRMADRAFREQQWQRRYEPHILPVNRLVDDLRVEKPDRWVPYVSPDYGGGNARVLFVFQDPGPGTNDNHSPTGSGFLCADNDDPSAELFKRCLIEVGVGIARVITWNAYPWYLPEQKPPTAAQIIEGIEPLLRLIDRLPRLRVVMPAGSIAQDQWRRIAERHPEVAGGHVVIPTVHTSRRGITRGGQTTRDEGVARLTGDLRSALDVIDT